MASLFDPDEPLFSLSDPDLQGGSYASSVNPSSAKPKPGGFDKALEGISLLGKVMRKVGAGLEGKEDPTLKEDLLRQQSQRQSDALALQSLQTLSQITKILGNDLADLYETNPEMGKRISTGIITSLNKLPGMEGRNITEEDIQYYVQNPGAREALANAYPFARSMLGRSDYRKAVGNGTVEKVDLTLGKEVANRALLALHSKGTFEGKNTGEVLQMIDVAGENIKEAQGARLSRYLPDDDPVWEQVEILSPKAAREARAKEPERRLAQEKEDRQQRQFEEREARMEKRAQETEERFLDAQRGIEKRHAETIKALAGQREFQREDTLRKEYLKESKEFGEVRDSYNRVLASADSPSPAGDLSIIFAYMKMLDPRSVVRESEFAVAETARPLLEKFGVSWSRVSSVWEGKRLTDSQRQDFVDRANKLYSRQQETQTKLTTEFRRLAAQSGLNPDKVIVDLNPTSTGKSVGGALSGAAPSKSEIEAAKRRLGLTK